MSVINLIISIVILAIPLLLLGRMVVLIIDETWVSIPDSYDISREAWYSITSQHGNTIIKNIINISVTNDMKKLMTTAKIVDPHHSYEWAVAFFSLATEVAYIKASTKDEYVTIRLKHKEEMRVKSNLFVNHQIRFKHKKDRREILRECDKLFVELHQQGDHRFKIEKKPRQLIAYVSQIMCQSRSPSSLIRVWLKLRFVYKMVKYYDTRNRR